MEDSAYEAIYTGVFILIFISALTITLFLFNSITEVAEKAYEYGNVSQTSAVLVNVPADEERYLNGSEVMSYVYNYIQRDIFGESTVNENYVIRIKNINGKTVEAKLTGNNVYNQLYKILNPKSKYILKYTQARTDGKVLITITQQS